MDKTADVHNIIESLVDPREKKSSNIQDVTVFSEIKNEHQKVKKPQRLRKQKKRLSRKESRDLGLFALPRKTMKYEDFVQLNELWNSYMEKQFDAKDVKDLMAKFNPAHPQYDQTSALIHKSDLHGASVKVVESKCASLVGHRGLIIMESKGTFSIISKDNTVRVIPKSDSVFELKWNSARFTVFGKHLCYRPADRSTKKIKQIQLCQL